MKHFLQRTILLAALLIALIGTAGSPRPKLADNNSAQPTAVAARSGGYEGTLVAWNS